MEKFMRYLNSYELTKLDINRIYRYIDKYISNSDTDNDLHEEFS